MDLFLGFMRTLEGADHATKNRYEKARNFSDLRPECHDSLFLRNDTRFSFNVSTRNCLASRSIYLQPYLVGMKAAKTSTSISTSNQQPAKRGNQEAKFLPVLDPVNGPSRRSLFSGKVPLREPVECIGCLAQKVAAMSCASSTIAVGPYLTP